MIHNILARKASLLRSKICDCDVPSQCHDQNRHSINHGFLWLLFDYLILEFQDWGPSLSKEATTSSNCLSLHGIFDNFDIYYLNYVLRIAKHYISSCLHGKKLCFDNFLHFLEKNNEK